MSEPFTIIEDIYFGITRWFVDSGMGRILGPFYKRAEAQAVLDQIIEEEV